MCIRDRCYTKVYLTDENGENPEEVAINQGTFDATASGGKYLIWIHVEDSAGNFNDYKYARTVDGPSAVVEDTVLYFADEFGERQVTPREDLYTGEYVTSATENAQVHGSDAGSFKVTFNNVATVSYTHLDVYKRQRVHFAAKVWHDEKDNWRKE